MTRSPTDSMRSLITIMTAPNNGWVSVYEIRSGWAGGEAQAKRCIEDLIEVGFIEWGLGKASIRKVCKN